MTLASLSNYELEKTLKEKVAQERKLTVEIINLLEEVSARKLHLQRGFSSIHEFCVKELGYSNASAYRRVQAMRVAKDIPEIKSALEEGRLQLANVAQAQTVFQQRAREDKGLTTEEKKEVLESLQNKSTREAEKMLLGLAPREVPKDRIREVSQSQTHVSAVISEEVMKKLDKVKNHFSHKNPNPSFAELIELMADVVLKAQRVSGAGNAVSRKTRVRKSRSTLRESVCGEIGSG
jgi:hypothetical protein